MSIAFGKEACARVKYMGSEGIHDKTLVENATLTERSWKEEIVKIHQS
jgi:hypothetical protein